MLQSGGNISTSDAYMQETVKKRLTARNFCFKTALDTRGTTDFLLKIARLIMGCGFGIAIFSNRTPPKTLGNIFFEVGYCLAVGKPVHLVFCGKNIVPSDFVRSEWIEYKNGSNVQFTRDLDASFEGLNNECQFMELLADTAFEAERMNPELAFERYKRVALINGSVTATSRIRDLQRLVKRNDVKGTYAPYRENLLESMKEFLRLFQ